jgi:hypothetical protein
MNGWVLLSFMSTVEILQWHQRLVLVVLRVKYLVHHRARGMFVVHNGQHLHDSRPERSPPSPQTLIFHHFGNNVEIHRY